MSLLNSPNSSQLDLYDNDHYSIPDDELQSVNSSAISFDGTDDTSMATDTDLHQASVTHKQRTGNPTEATEGSHTSEWTTHTSRKHQAIRSTKVLRQIYILTPACQIGIYLTFVGEEWRMFKMA